MKKYIKKHRTFFIIIIIVCAITVIYNASTIESYVIAAQNGMHVTEIRFGPYYRITEGTNREQEIKYIIKVYRNKQNYIISQDEGITQAEALQIAKNNGFTIEKNESELLISTNRIGRFDSREAVRKNLVWLLFYDRANGLYVEVNFETGVLVDFPHKVSSNM